MDAFAEKDAQIASLKGEISKIQGKMCGDVDIKEVSFVDRSSTLNITYKTASPIDPRKAALGGIKDKIRDVVRFFNEDFGSLSGHEIESIKSLV